MNLSTSTQAGIDLGSANHKFLDELIHVEYDSPQSQVYDSPNPNSAQLSFSRSTWAEVLLTPKRQRTKRKKDANVLAFGAVSISESEKNSAPVSPGLGALRRISSRRRSSGKYASDLA